MRAKETVIRVLKLALADAAIADEDTLPLIDAIEWVKKSPESPGAHGAGCQCTSCQHNSEMMRLAAQSGAMAKGR